MNVVACPSCSKQLKYNPQQAGKQVRCPACQTAMILPGAPNPAPPANQPVQPSPVAPQQVPTGGQQTNPLLGQTFDPLAPTNQQSFAQSPSAYPQNYSSSPQAKRTPKKKNGLNPVVLWGSIGGGVLVVAIVILVIVMNSGGGSETTAKDDTANGSGKPDSGSTNTASKTKTQSQSGQTEQGAKETPLQNGSDASNKALSRKKADEALRAFGQDNGNQALKLWDEAIELDPTNVKALIDRAFHRLLAEDPETGNVARDLNRMHEIAQLGYLDYSKAIELDPNAAIAYAGRAQILQDLINFEIEDYKGEADKIRSLFMPLVDLSDLPALAIADYEKAIELAPNHKLVDFWKIDIDLIKDFDE